jgi:hypothetical protein
MAWRHKGSSHTNPVGVLQEAHRARHATPEGGEAELVRPTDGGPGCRSRGPGGVEPAPQRESRARPPSLAGTATPERGETTRDLAPNGGPWSRGADSRTLVGRLVLARVEGVCEELQLWRRALEPLHHVGSAVP